MKSKYKPLIRVIAILAVLDMLGIITMIANPDLVERVIPALAGVQILGFIVIAFVSINARRSDTADSSGVQSTSSKEWVLWLFGVIALLYFMRAGLAARVAGVKFLLLHCFVIMPFGQPFDRYYLNIYIPAITEVGLKPFRADSISRHRRLWQTCGD